MSIWGNKVESCCPTITQILFKLWYQNGCKTLLLNYYTLLYSNLIIFYWLWHTCILESSDGSLIIITGYSSTDPLQFRCLLFSSVVIVVGDDDGNEVTDAQERGEGGSGDFWSEVECSRLGDDEVVRSGISTVRCCCCCSQDDVFVGDIEESGGGVDKPEATEDEESNLPLLLLWWWWWWWWWWLLISTSLQIALHSVSSTSISSLSLLPSSGWSSRTCFFGLPLRRPLEIDCEIKSSAVSYTHLTLPTKA